VYTSYLDMCVNKSGFAYTLPSGRIRKLRQNGGIWTIGFHTTRTPTFPRKVSSIILRKITSPRARH
jgi:hypothetical protein